MLWRIRAWWDLWWKLIHLRPTQIGLVIITQHNKLTGARCCTKKHTNYTEASHRCQVKTSWKSSIKWTFSGFVFGYKHIFDSVFRSLKYLQWINSIDLLMHHCSKLLKLYCVFKFIEMCLCVFNRCDKISPRYQPTINSLHTVVCTLTLWCSWSHNVTPIT